MNPWSTHLWLKMIFIDQSKNLISLITTVLIKQKLKMCVWKYWCFHCDRECEGPFIIFSCQAHLKSLKFNTSAFTFYIHCVKAGFILRFLPPTQHSTGHQDVEKGFSIAAVVELGTRRIQELCNSFQIGASLVQTLNDALLKLARFKSLLFICWSI